MVRWGFGSCLWGEMEEGSIRAVALNLLIHIILYKFWIPYLSLMTVIHHCNVRMCVYWALFCDFWWVWVTKTSIFIFYSSLFIYYSPYSSMMTVIHHWNVRVCVYSSVFCYILWVRVQKRRLFIILFIFIQLLLTIFILCSPIHLGALSFALLCPCRGPGTTLWLFFATVWELFLGLLTVIHLCRCYSSLFFLVGYFFLLVTSKSIL